MVHFAAESHVDRSILGAADFVMTNVVGTQTLLDSALEHGIERFVHVSTDEVYGSIEEGSWDEEQPLQPNSPYSASKASSDLLARAYHRTHGLPVCDHAVLEQLRALPVPREGHPAVRHQPDRRGARCRCTARARTSATGCTSTTTAAGIHLVLERRPGRRGLQHRRRHRAVQQGADRAAARGHRHRLGPGQERRPTGSGHDLRYSVDITKISDELGYEPQVPFEQGLADTVEWYRTNRAWWEPLKERASSRTDPAGLAADQAPGCLVGRRGRRARGSRPESGRRRPGGRAAGSQVGTVAAGRRPVDGDRGVERVDAVLAVGCVHRGAQVADDRVVLRAP